MSPQRNPRVPQSQRQVTGMNGGVADTSGEAERPFLSARKTSTMNNSAQVWQTAIQAAQQETTYLLDGASYARLPYGAERYPEGYPAEWLDTPLPAHCHDCAVPLGQLHVPGCDMERCPKCQGQAISCGCETSA